MATGNNSNLLPPLRTPHALTPSAATPSRRAISADPSTTASGRRLSLSARRRGANATATPHAKAAFRSLDQRRAAIFTPGRRRQSLRDTRRETQHDVLRNLSRTLAPTSAVIESSSVSSSSSPHDGVGGLRRSRRGRRSRGDGDDTTLGTLDELDEDDDDFPIERPRFSLPGMDDDDDDDDDLKPPRLSGLEDDNYTAQSIELPRRAWSEAPSLGRRDRGSLGSVRFSDYVGPELMSDGGAEIDSGFFPPPGLDDDDDDDDGGMLLDEQAMVERYVPSFLLLITLLSSLLLSLVALCVVCGVWLLGKTMLTPGKQI